MMPQLFKEWPIDLKFIWFPVGILAFAILLWIRFSWQMKWREQSEKPPQGEKLLRPAGYSLGMRMDRVMSDIVETIMGAAFMWGLGVSLAVFMIAILAIPELFLWGLGFGIVSLYYLVRGYVLMKEILQ